MKRIVLPTASALIASGALALPAVAGEHPNDRAGMLGVGAVAASTLAEQAPAASSGRPDGREMPDGVDLALAPAQPTIVVASDGFDWTDAGVGLAGGLGLALVLGGALVATQHARHMTRVS